MPTTTAVPTLSGGALTMTDLIRYIVIGVHENGREYRIVTVDAPDEAAARDTAVLTNHLVSASCDVFTDEHLASCVDEWSADHADFVCQE